MRYLVFTITFFITAAMTVVALAVDEERSHVVLASTTSIENSGLLDFLLPIFSKESDIDVRVIPVGTGRALNIARRGDADMLIIHHEPSELEFMREKSGVLRKTFMYNDYVVVGPRDDPAQIRNMQNISSAFATIAANKSLFVSRGDDSGTHLTELALWRETPAMAPPPTHYLEIGGGMGATLTFVNETGAYTLCDRATWHNFGNRDKLDLLVVNSPPLKNSYSIILVNPEKNAGINFKAAKEFYDWLTSSRGLDLIAAFRVKGEGLFTSVSE